MGQQSPLGIESITATAFNAAAVNRFADHVLRRSSSNAQGSSDGDTLAFRSLYGAVAKLTNKVTVTNSTLVVYGVNDSTTIGTQTLTTSSDATPITGADTN